MEFYSTYQISTLIAGFFADNWTQLFSFSLGIGLLLWLALFILQGVGLSTMAKNRDMKKRWLAFIPFVNIWYMAKLAGECQLFGHKVKRIGVYAMIAQIVTTVFTIATITAEMYLYINHGAPAMSENYLGGYCWAGLTGFSKTVENFYCNSELLLSIFQLVYGLSQLVIMIGLCKKYAAKNYFALSFISFLVPVAKFIVVFCIRNNKAVDYEAYMRAKREEYMRRQQQYRNTYGNPYNNPYGNPYGNPYHRGGYGPYGQNPYGQNPYEQNGRGAQEQAPQEEPFSEFSSDKGEGNDRTAPSSDETKNGGENGSDPDDFFS